MGEWSSVFNGNALMGNQLYRGSIIFRDGTFTLGKMLSGIMLFFARSYKNSITALAHSPVMNVLQGMVKHGKGWIMAMETIPGNTDDCQSAGQSIR